MIAYRLARIARPLAAPARVLLAVAFAVGALVTPLLPAPLAPIPAHAAPAARPLGQYLGTHYSDTIGPAHFQAYGNYFTTEGTLIGAVWRFHLNSGSGAIDTKRMGWGYPQAWGDTSETAGFDTYQCQINTFYGGAAACAAIQPGSTFVTGYFAVQPPGTLLGAGFQGCQWIDCNLTVDWWPVYDGSPPTATPTTTPTATLTPTPAVPPDTQTAEAATGTALAGTSAAATATSAAATGTSAAATATSAAATGTAGGGASPTPTNTSIFAPPTIGGNLIVNWDMNVAPLNPGAAWYTMNRVIQSPIQGDPTRVGGLAGGSCGPKYWNMTTPVGNDSGVPGAMWQGFYWPGGDMYVNFEAQTSEYFTIGKATIKNNDTGLSYVLGNVYNPFGSWLTFNYKLPNMSVGRYTLMFEMSQPVIGPEGFAVDNVNVRTGGWGNDCTDNYQGSIPPQTPHVTPTPVPQATPLPPNWGSNLLNNCDFEQGGQDWTLNSGAVQTSPGGATGPTYYQLFDPGSFLFPPVALPGDIWQAFDWPGGTMYTSFWLKDGSAVNLSITNRAIGFSSSIYDVAPATSATGWTKETFYLPANQPGSYVFELHTDPGGNAGVDGAAVASGSFATGACSSQSAPGDNATQAATEATGTAVAGTAAPDLTSTAAAQQTQDASALQTRVANLYQTATALSGGATDTQAAAQTQTQAVNQTATAQGTPVPSATATAAPIFTASPTVPPLPTVPPATQTADVAGVYATQTAVAAQIQTAQANVAASQTALSRYQTAVAQTQTQQAAVNQTQQAIILATAYARQTGTAAASTQTQQAGATQTQQAKNNATQTQSAGATQTALVATNDMTAQAAATLTAVATQNALATQQAQATVTAQAQATAAAIATAQALGTQEVQPRPEPAPYVDCNRPTNPLALADWIDYEVCRMLSWWVWTPDNTQQVLALQAGLQSYEPIGTLLELDNARIVAQAQLSQYDWANTGTQQDDTILPNVLIFFPTTVPIGLLTGHFTLAPGQSGTFDFNFVTTCTLKTGNIFGQAMAEGLCAFINWLVATGIMGWVQFLFDVAVWIAFLRYAWYAVTVKLPQII